MRRRRLVWLVAAVVVAIGSIVAVLAVLAFVVFAGGDRQFFHAYVTDWSGDREIQLYPWDEFDSGPVTCNEHDDDDPALSADGKQLAFASDRDGDWDIYLLLDLRCEHPERAESSVEQLTDVPGADRNPAWSPDGKRLAFESERTGVTQIFVMDRDGSNLTQVTTGDASSHAPSWSSFGSRLAFHSSADAGGDSDIYTINPDGTDLQRVTSTPGNDASPVWDLADSKIAFVSDRDGTRRIYVVDLEARTETRVTNGVAEEIDPAHCGNELCFASNPDGNWDIYSQSAFGGSAEIAISQGPSNETSPAFSKRRLP